MTVNHSGTLVWNDAIYGGSGTGGRAAFNLNFLTNSEAREIAYRSEPGSVVIVNANPNLTANRTITGVAGYGRRQGGVVNIENGGRVEVNGALAPVSGNSNYLAAITALGRNVTVVNTGKAVVNSTGAGQAISVSLAHTNAGNTGPSQMTLINSGEISVYSPMTFAPLSPSVSSPVAAAVDLEAPSTSPASITLENSGTIKISGGAPSSDGRTAILLFGGSAPNTFTIRNQASGEIVSEDPQPVAIHTIGQSRLHLDNLGKISGDINGGLLDDLINFGAGGAITGNVKLLTGDDTLNWMGGALAGSIQMGDGSDAVNVSAAEFDGSQLLDGGDDVSAADGWVDTLTFSNLAATADGTKLINWENIVLDNATLTLSNGTLTTGSDPGTGLFIGGGGVLNAPGSLTLTGNMDVAAGGLFWGSGAGGAHAISGDLTNAGTVSTQNGAAGDTITVGGRYSGVGGVLRLDTALGGDASPTDRLNVTGDTAGTTQIAVSNAGGLGGLTVTGIKIVDVGGASGGLFSLLGDYTFEGQPAVVGGAYAYTLQKVGGNWYLHSQLTPIAPEEPEEPGVPPSVPSTPGAPAPQLPAPIYQPGVPAYETYPQLLLGLNGLPTLQQRVGNRYWNGGLAGPGTDASAAGGSAERSGAWGVVAGRRIEMAPRRSTSGTEFTLQSGQLRAGFDGFVSETESGTFVAGVMGHYSWGRSDHASRFGPGGISADGFGAGLTGTWYGNNGFYADGQAQATWFDSDLSSDWAGRLTSGNRGFGYALSIEAGQRIGVAPAWTLIPQAQLAYSSVRFDSFADRFGAWVTHGDSDSLRGRLGLAVEHQSTGTSETGQVNRLALYGVANLHYEFLDDVSVTVSGVRVGAKNDRLWTEVGLGGSYNWKNDAYSLYGEVSVSASLRDPSDNHAFSGRAGFRMKW